MRLFLAFTPSADVRSALAKLREELRPELPGLRWVSPEKLHVTLRFLGDVSDPGVASLALGLKEALSGGRRFRVSFRGVGVFPPRGRARVLWAGIEDVSSALRDLRESADRAVQAHGVAPDPRGFRPHLTLARFRQHVPDFGAVLDDHRDRVFGMSEIVEIVLFRSELRPDGPRYTARERYPLLGHQGKSLV